MNTGQHKPVGISFEYHQKLFQLLHVQARSLLFFQSFSLFTALSRWINLANINSDFIFRLTQGSKWGPGH